MGTCPNGHENLLPARYCGECGIPLDRADLSAPTSSPPSDGGVISCPNGHQSPADQSYCGECGAPLPVTGWRMSATTGPSPASWTPPPPPTAHKLRGLPRWGWIVLICALVVAVIATVAVVYTIRHQKDSRWSAFPHTMACVVTPLNYQPYEPGIISAPLLELARVERVTMTHPGGQRIALSIQFSHGTPPLRQVNLPHPALGYNVPVSLKYDLTISGQGHGDDNVYLSTTDGTKWKADASGVVIISSNRTEDAFDVVIDLEGGRSELRDEGWTPNVQIGVSGESRPTPLSGAYEVWVFDFQWCNWNSPPSKQSSGSPEPTTTLQASPRPPASSPAQTAIPQPPVSANARSPLPDADAHGFVGYQGGRCRDADVAVAMGRTADSLAVICQNSDGKLYYVGFGLHNGLPVVLERVLRYWDDGYTVNNLDYQYTVTPEMLEIDQGQGVLSREQWIEYWPR